MPQQASPQPYAADGSPDFKGEFIRANKSFEHACAVLEADRMRGIADMAVSSAFLVPAGGDVRKAFKAAYATMRETESSSRHAQAMRQVMGDDEIPF